MNTKFIHALALCASLFGLGACSTPPPPPPMLTEQPVITRPARPNHSIVADSPIDERPDGEVSEGIEPAIAEANRVWAAGSTDRTAYVAAGRLLLPILSQPLRGEDQLRIAVTLLQHALCGDDVETLRKGVAHWESAFGRVARIPRPGEIETYLFAMRRLRREPPPDLLQLTNPELRTLLSQN